MAEQETLRELRSIGYVDAREAIEMTFRKNREDLFGQSLLPLQNGDVIRRLVPPIKPPGTKARNKISPLVTAEFYIHGRNLVGRMTGTKIIKVVAKAGKAGGE